MKIFYTKVFTNLEKLKSIKDKKMGDNILAFQISATVYLAAFKLKGFYISFKQWLIHQLGYWFGCPP